MENNGSEPLNNQIKAMQEKISKLEERVIKLENRAKISRPDITVETPETSTVTGKPVQKSIDWESMTGASQLGWIAIIISLVGAAFFVRLTFTQNWITGWGQPVTLGLLCTILIFISDRLIIHNYKKFGSCLTVCGYALAFLTVYWPAIHLGLIAKDAVIYSSAFLLAFSIAWGFFRGTSIWPVWGFVAAGILPLLILGSDFGDTAIFIYYIIIFAAGISASVIKNWHWTSISGSLTGLAVIIVSIRHFSNYEYGNTALIIGTVAFMPSLLILWSSAVHIINRRKIKIIELSAWIFNNIILFALLKTLSKKIDTQIMLIIPVILNGIIYYSARYRLNDKDKKPNLAYLIGLVFSAAIAMTVMLPIPMDIIMLSLFTVLLAYLGNRKHGWHLKGLSGAMVVWCIIFLFAARFGFTKDGEVPFANLRFVSFLVTFLCFGYQGKMINSDPSAGKMGPFLGQGLFSLGLLVLLGGMTGEILHLFPAKNHELISQNALLGLTILGAIFSFTVTYTGIALRLFFIRILALGLFIILLSKMIFFDLYMLKAVYLIISLAIVGVLLGGTSFILKKFASSKKKQEIDSA